MDDENGGTPMTQETQVSKPGASAARSSLERHLLQPGLDFRFRHRLVNANGIPILSSILFVSLQDLQVFCLSLGTVRRSTDDRVTLRVDALKCKERLITGHCIDRKEVSQNCQLKAPVNDMFSSSRIEFQ